MGGGTVPPPKQTFVTRWGADPFSRGSYSYYSVGNKREIVGGWFCIVIWGCTAGRLLFAGKATTRHPATCAHTLNTHIHTPHTHTQTTLLRPSAACCSLARPPHVTPPPRTVPTNPGCAKRRASSHCAAQRRLAPAPAPQLPQPLLAPAPVPQLLQSPHPLLVLASLLAARRRPRRGRRALAACLCKGFRAGVQGCRDAGRNAPQRFVPLARL